MWYIWRAVMVTFTSEILPLVHLVTLALWGGVVATEAVIEILPFRHPELHTATIRMHYWIDLLVELPLVLAVIATGCTLLFLTDEITILHLVKITFGGTAIAINLFCIAIVLRRSSHLKRGNEAALWQESRIVLACFAAGLLCATVTASLGFRLAITRLS